jgi:DNA polymerase-3 subunit delta
VKIQANQLSSYLKKNLAPCYLVTGDEHLLVAEALDSIRLAAREKGFTARESHVATRYFDWSSLAASSANLSLFAEQRIIELRLPTGKPGMEGSKAIVALVDQLGPELMLIVSAPKLESRSTSAKWVKTLESAGVFLPIWPVSVRELPAWVEARMRAAGLQPERTAAALIADRVEGNLLAANQEVEKLRLLLGEGPVSAEDVAAAVANSSRYDVYKLVDATLAGEAQRAVKILGGLRAEGLEPIIVFWALARELRVLIRLADDVRQRVDLGAAMQKAGVWRNRQGLVRSCVSRVPDGTFRHLLQAVGRGDAAAKGQMHGDPWQLATDIVIGLACAGRRAA